MVKRINNICNETSIGPNDFSVLSNALSMIWGSVMSTMKVEIEDSNAFHESSLRYCECRLCTGRIGNPRCIDPSVCCFSNPQYHVLRAFEDRTGTQLILELRDGESAQRE